MSFCPNLTVAQQNSEPDYILTNFCLTSKLYHQKSDIEIWSDLDCNLPHVCHNLTVPCYNSVLTVARENSDSNLPPAKD